MNLGFEATHIMGSMTTFNVARQIYWLIGRLRRGRDSGLGRNRT